MHALPLHGRALSEIRPAVVQSNGLRIQGRLAADCYPGVIGTLFCRLYDGFVLTHKSLKVVCDTTEAHLSSPNMLFGGHRTFDINHKLTRAGPTSQTLATARSCTAGTQNCFATRARTSQFRCSKPRRVRAAAGTVGFKGPRRRYYADSSLCSMFMYET